LKEADKVPLPIKQERAEAHAEMSARFTGKAAEIIDSISPEDLQSGRIPIYKKAKDPETGEETQVFDGYKYWGPRLVEKATAAGIFQDKARVSRDLERTLDESTGSGELLMPQSVEELENAIRQGAKELTFLNVKFQDEDADLATQIDSTLLAVQQAREAEVEDVVPDDGY